MGGSPALSPPSPPGPELHTVTDTEAVVFNGPHAERLDGLRPSPEYELAGLRFRTLSRPPGERLAVVAAVNDVHLGERECGRMEGHEVGPVLRSPPGGAPYPETMNRAAAAEIAALGPDLVVAKGDLTAEGRPEEYTVFEACYRPGLGDRLVVTRGNHDNRAGGAAFEVPPVQVRHVEGATVVVLDSSRPGEEGGTLDAGQLDALDAIAADADRPVLVFAHHPVRDASDADWMGDASALDAASTAGLLAVVGRRKRIAGYLAGHTHRNRVRRFAATASVPFAEVACTKDFPGSWAEYRVFEGGMLAVHHRIADRAALVWSEACRALVFGLYPGYAFGRIEDRCFTLGGDFPQSVEKSVD